MQINADTHRTQGYLYIYLPQNSVFKYNGFV